MPSLPHAQAIAHLVAQDAAWGPVVAQVGPCTWAPEPREPYEALISAVAHQQVHGKAAQAILGRLRAAVPGEGFPSPEALLALPEEALRACGFSARKAQTLRGIAEGIRSGLVPSLTEAQGLEDEAIVARLVALKGVGPWTAQMLLMFTLGRPDVWPVDDFGVRQGFRRWRGLEDLPTPKALQAAGEAWRPHRSVAAWYLWRVAEGLAAGPV